MNVLIFCEESQAECLAFRRKGHNAFSCDLKKCSGGHPEYHIYGDGSSFVNGYCTFITQDGTVHYDVYERKWDLVIAHPPCTYLSRAGACNLFDFYGHIKDQRRYNQGLDAKRFFDFCLNIDCERLCVENPIPIGIFGLPTPSQYIEPYYFGDPYTKKTGLWLKGLPHLVATHTLDDYDSIDSWCKLHSDATIRSKSFNGVSNAMANQWFEGCKPLQIDIWEVLNESY